MDDSADKIRRNLLVFCAIIISFEYLNVSPSKMVEAFVSDKLLLKTPEKIWHLVAVIFTYIAYRFAVLKESNRQLITVMNAFSGDLGASLRNDIIRTANMLVHGKSLPNSIKFLNRADAPCNDDIKLITKIELKPNFQIGQVSYLSKMFVAQEYEIMWTVDAGQTDNNTGSKSILAFQKTANAIIAQSWLVSILALVKAAGKVARMWEASEILIPLVAYFMTTLIITQHIIK